jgi:hypothetical protein
MAYLEPYTSWLGDRTDRLFRLEIWHRVFDASQPRIIRLVFLPTTPVLVLRQELQRITQIPVEAQQLTVTYPTRFPAILEPLENHHTLEEVGLKGFSTLRLETETRADFDRVGSALMALLEVILIVKWVVSTFVLFKGWSEQAGVS